MSSTKFEIHPAARKSIDDLAEKARQFVLPIELEHAGETRPRGWGPKPQVTVTPDDLVDDPIGWLNTADGRQAWAFLWKDDVCFGIVEEQYEAVDRLIDALLKISWVKASVSDDYIRTTFVKWVRICVRSGVSGTFVDVFIDATQNDVSEQEIWLPVQNLHIETEFPFGSVRFVPLDEHFFDRMAGIGRDVPEEQKRRFGGLITSMKQRMLGLAAVNLRVFAEPKYAGTAALQIADDAVGLLRFFSAAAFGAQHMTGVSLLDALAVPKTHVIVGDLDSDASYSSSLVTNSGEHIWLISRTDYVELSKGEWSAVAGLLDNNSLNDFGKTVRSSILAFSRALTFPELADRLIFVMSAVEGLLLRDQNESIQQNVGERMAFSIASEPEKRRAIVANLREAYRMRSQYIHHRLSTTDISIIDVAFWNIRAMLSQAVANLNRFQNKSQFIEAIERRKFGG